MRRLLKVFCFALAIFLLLAGVSFSYFNSSTSGEFNVSAYVRLSLENGLKGNISVNNTRNYNISVTFDNSSALESIYGNLDFSLFLFVINETGYYSDTNFILNNSLANFTLIAYCNETCFPGKYKTNFLIHNSTNINENATVEVEVDWPILVNENGTAIFFGTFPFLSTTYHSFYFNTSNLTNATGVSIFLFSWTNEYNELDIFLVDKKGELKAKPLFSETFCNESVCYNTKLLSYRNLPKNEIWEIRIASSSDIPYSGILTLTTLNVTNGSKIIDKIRFGELNSTLNRKSAVIELRNEGQRPLEVESELNYTILYYFRKFEGSGSREFEVLIPGQEIVNYTDFSLVWKGNSNYSIKVYDPSGTLRGESSDKSISARVCNVEREEFIRITRENILPGYWKIVVSNSTPSSDNYNLTVFFYLNSSQWFESNFSKAILNNTNTTKVNVSLKLGKQYLDGEYGGYITYFHNENGLAFVTVPFSASVNTSMLVVNKTFKKDFIRITESTDFNITKTFRVTVENPGSYILNLNCSKQILRNKDNPNKIIDLDVDCPSSISPNSSGLLNVTLKINTLNTSNTLGLYEGLVYLNSSEAQPYNHFNLTIQVNLSNELKVKIYDLKTADGDKEVENPNLSENVTLVFNVTLVNSSSFETLTKDNFEVVLNHTNVTYLKKFSVSNATSTIFKGNYSVNFTLPAQFPGGYYSVILNVTYGSLKGKDFFNYLLVNNTALMLKLSSTDFSVYNGSNFLVNVSIDNFGPLNATNAKIRIVIGNCLASVSFKEGKCEGKTLTGTQDVVFNLSANKVNACYVVWNVTAGTPSDTTAFCDSKIEGYNATFFGNLTFWTSVEKRTDREAPGGAQPTYLYNLTFIKVEKLIVVKQNSTNSTIVIVRNTGNASQEVFFGILYINSSWYKINSTNVTLAPNQETAFLVNFTLGMEEPKDYSGKFRAYSLNKTIISEFTLRVLPLVILNESQIREINDTLLLYEVRMLNYSLQINVSKEKGYNVSTAEAILSQLKEKIEEAKSYVAKGNYLAAQALFPTIQSLFDRLKEELEKVEKPEEGLNLTLIIIILVAGAGILVLIYLFWPTKTGYIPEKKKYVYKPRGEKIRKELREKWEKATKRVK
ncbi:MAG: hypothetical protein NZ942_00860 [Candidatus Aenigmarchaeota archaeon]|nr:hypothetical protein [Candidatus Aenigmarchaeota archaeon]